MKIIDPHLHLFDLAQGDYHWLKKENPPFWPDKQLIAKNFSQDNLNLVPPLELAGFVHIEAGFDNEAPWREIDWLEASCSLPFRSVAFLDLTLATECFAGQLEKLGQFSSLAGIRHILDEEAEALLASTQVKANLAQLADNGLSFDVQMPLANAKAVNLLARILTDYPKLKIIINHAGWPGVKQPEFQLWQQGIEKLSKFSQCAIKCSGWEMTDRSYSSHWQTEAIKLCIHHFGADRVMLASNFPLCLFHCGYQDYWRRLIELLSPILGREAVQKLCFDNAKQWYEI